jgi:hypothetical protein
MRQERADMSTHLEAMNATGLKKRSTPASAKGRTNFVP